MTTRNRNEQGFTLPELLVVAGVIVLLMFGSVILLRPASYDDQIDNGKRRTDVAHLAQALLRYKAAKGHFPPDISPSATAIGSEDAQYNLCSTLVPGFIKDIPIDPAVGIKYKNTSNYDETKEPCTARDVIFASGYAMLRNDDGSIRLYAPAAEGEKVEITIR